MSNRGPEKKLVKVWKCSNPDCAKEFIGTKWELMQSLGVKTTPFTCKCGARFISSLPEEKANA